MMTWVFGRSFEVMSFLTIMRSLISGMFSVLGGGGAIVTGMSLGWTTGFGGSIWRSSCFLKKVLIVSLAVSDCETMMKAKATNMIACKTIVMVADSACCSAR